MNKIILVGILLLCLVLLSGCNENHETEKKDYCAGMANECLEHSNWTVIICDDEGIECEVNPERNPCEIKYVKCIDRYC